MPEIKLFVSPGSCARVATIGLEEIGTPFETELIYTGAKQQKSPEYLAVNPKGKVPAILIDGVPLTENVAILSWLNKTFPEAGLLPAPKTDLDTYQQIADLAFFSGTAHPHVTRIAMPMKFVDDADKGFELVRPNGIAAMMPVMGMVQDRLKDNGPWWYGEDWSILDAYLFWIWWRIRSVNFPDENFPVLRAHAEAMLERPAVERAMKREAVYIEQLKADGLYVAPN